MKKQIIFAAMAIAGIISITILLFWRQIHSAQKTRFTIGVLQTASHPALDAVRNGFMDELKSALNNDVTFVVRNAQGNIAQAHTIAQHFHADTSLDGILAIATPAAQAITAVEKEKPIFIGAVTNPAELGILQPNVCGTSDMINVDQEVDALTKLMPQIKSVAILFNPGESNSVSLVKLMHAALKKAHIESIEIGVQTEADIPTAVESALKKADALLTPTDNMVASAITLISAEANKAQKPLIVSDNTLVKHGALMARGIDYNTSGREAAHQALQVLTEGKKPADLSVKSSKSDLVVINKERLDTFGLEIPESLKENSSVIMPQ